MHVVHDEPRSEDRRQRQHGGEERKGDQLEPQRRGQAHREGGGEPNGERRDDEDESDDDHRQGWNR